MKYPQLLAILAALLALTSSLPNPVYSIHYLKSYRGDLVSNNFGCGKSIAYGTYVYPLGPVDALYALINSHVYGFSSNCQRPATYVKLFGDAQDYDILLKDTAAVVNHMTQTLRRVPTKNVIIDWKYMP